MVLDYELHVEGISLDDLKEVIEAGTGVTCKVFPDETLEEVDYGLEQASPRPRSRKNTVSIFVKTPRPQSESLGNRTKKPFTTEESPTETGYPAGYEKAGQKDLEAKVLTLADTVERYKSELRRKDKKMSEIIRAAEEGKETLASFHTRQKQMFEKFCLLRQKYDGLKRHLCEVLWEVIPSGHIPGVERQGPDWLEAIPPLDNGVTESLTQIGDYEIGEVLGEGQFAAVRSIKPLKDTKNDGVHQPIENTSYGPLAVKMIHKAGVVSLTTLRRVDNEIAVLRSLSHDGIMKLHKVIHAPTSLYMVTDRAGRDLFEFFDEHLDGVSEKVACQLLHKIMAPVLYCHNMGICHRDLKPENILFKDKEDPPLLHEFCGSPGFFAPEMLIKGQYDGKKADAWSLGCILLELVLGHEDFCRLWMTAYEYDNLKNAREFEVAISKAVTQLPVEICSRFSAEICDFLTRALNLDSSKRASILSMVYHPWMSKHGLATTPSKELQCSGDNNETMVNLPTSLQTDTAPSGSGTASKVDTSLGTAAPVGQATNPDEETATVAPAKVASALHTSNTTNKITGRHRSFTAQPLTPSISRAQKEFMTKWDEIAGRVFVSATVQQNDSVRVESSPGSSPSSITEGLSQVSNKCFFPEEETPHEQDVPQILGSPGNCSPNIDVLGERVGQETAESTLPLPLRRTLEGPT